MGVPQCGQWEKEAPLNLDCGIWTNSCGCMLIDCLCVWVILGRINWLNTFRIFGYCFSWTCALWRIFLGKTTSIHTILLFRSFSSGACAWWGRTNLFFLTCLGRLTFIYTIPWLSISISTSSYFGNTLLWLEKTQCHSTTSRQNLITHYNATIFSLSSTLQDKIQNAR